MDNQELERLSPEELLARVAALEARLAALEQHIEGLQRAVTSFSALVAELVARVQTLEGEACLLRRLLQSTSLTTVVPDDTVEIMREALRRLHDPDRLANCRLASLLARVWKRPLDGHALRLVLRQAIERLRPPGELSNQVREHRYYRLLRLTYEERRKVQEVAKELALSERQYYRELRVAIGMVADAVLRGRIENGVG